jgi:hypothetical protein
MGISIELSKYSNEHKIAWDEFLSKTEPGSVLHYRDYMDYHSNRFEDFSVCFWEYDELVAIIPGNSIENSWHSHQGLTFGGLITTTRDVSQIIKLNLLLCEYLVKNSFTTSTITISPNSFWEKGNAEQIYALNQLNYKTVEVHLNQFIGMDRKMPPKKHSNARAADRKGVTLSTSAHYLQELYQLIDRNLLEKYDRKPVHTFPELKSLCESFPKKIVVFTMILENEVVAGAVIFVSKYCLHIQYLAASNRGRTLRAQDLLITKLDEFAKQENRNLSFGKSTSGLDAALNEQLFRFKSEYGAVPENIFTLTKILS